MAGPKGLCPSRTARYSGSLFECPDDLANISLDSKLVLRCNRRAMQTLGLSDSTPRSESRLKTLFWPSIQSGSDVDYLGAQGYWVCAVVALVSLVVLVFRGNSILGPVVFIFYYVGGVGVRERSRYAAAVVLLMYVLDALFARPGVLTVLFSALLLSNLRATWIAASWQPGSDAAALPPRFGDTWGEKFADKLPAFLWPKVRVLYYVFSAGYLIFIVFGLTIFMSRPIFTLEPQRNPVAHTNKQLLTSHSCRNATSGSVRIARRAGI